MGGARRPGHRFARASPGRSSASQNALTPLLYLVTPLMPDPSKFFERGSILPTTLEIFAIHACPAYLPIYKRTKT